jgi:hypothetical protein
VRDAADAVADIITEDAAYTLAHAATQAEA